MIEKLVPLLQPQQRYALITDSRVARLYGNTLHQTLRARGYDGELFAFAEGEENKTRRTKEEIEDQMFQAQMDRETIIIALGGGVVTDLAGFVAATYCRGLRWICIPTTLMGMVDAGIGGKTGVNLPKAKNRVGVFYPATHLIIHEPFLKTLSDLEMQNGFAEIVKYALIASPSLFESLENQRYQENISLCMSIKQKIVDADLCENNLRRILNFGHTFGHALEQVMNYRIQHGVAVAAGLIFESFISHDLGHLSYEDVERIRSLLSGFTFPKMAFDDLIEAMRQDKKNREGKIAFVILEEVGKAASCEGRYCRDVDITQLERAYEYLYR